VIAKVKDLIGQKIYLVGLPEEQNVGYSKTFTKNIGVISKVRASYYDYQIFFDELNNAYLCNGDEKINVRTKAKHPEYFL